MIGIAIVPLAVILFILRGSYHHKSSTRDARSKDSLSNDNGCKNTMSLQNHESSGAAEDLAKNYFPARPLTPKQKDLLLYIQQLKADHAENDDDNEDGGHECTGEPRVDPSRQIQPNQGDSEWINDW